MENKKNIICEIVGSLNLDFYGFCCDHCPAPFSYFVRQKGYFHPFPLTVGI